MSIPRRLEAMKYMAVMQAPQPYCYIENGYDYVDNDIGNEPADDASKCCQKCYVFPKCSAWSWSNLNGGTCWFKSAQGAIVVNANVKSSLLLYSPPNVCQLQADIDYVDNDLARVNSPTASGCCDLCRNYPGCRAFSHNNYNGGSCWFKKAKGQTVPATGVTSAEVYPAPPKDSSCPNALQENTDYVDNDIGNAKSSTPGGCCTICKNWNGNGVCRAFSWSNYGGGTCWLKSAKGNTMQKNGVTSSTILDNPPVSCVLEDGIDYVGNDFANVPGTADSCCAACKAKAPMCKAYSWSNHQGGTCWLKTAKGQTAMNPNVKSAII
uniref:Apple domain-containing protein n=1 Tax=Globisporangium ultimum (strain ATCC 200006 / CBS 805.95 / DAOM BR144) TaxID=431595 RepID=K3WCU9_GLOUD